MVAVVASAVALIGGIVAIMSSTAAGYVSYSSDPNAAVGSATQVPALSTSTGIATAPWPDPFCRPIEGTANTDPGQAPTSWAQFLASAVFGHTAEMGWEEAVQQAVAQGWNSYVQENKTTPPGYSSLDDAKSKLWSTAKAVLLEQSTWEGIIARFGNVYKPTAADPQEFLAHLDQYASGVQDPVCDGNDGYRLYQSNGGNALWQLEPDGSWAKLIYDAGAPQPPENVTWRTVPGATRSYMASVPTGDPLGVNSPVLMRVVGELTIGEGANVHSCLTNEANTATVVGSQLGADVYNTIRNAASWVPPLPSLPGFSDSCATIPAVYTEWSSGPAIDTAPAISTRAEYLAGYTATSTSGSIDRWHRTGTTWSPGEPFAGPTFNWGGDEVQPRLAISGMDRRWRAAS